MYKVKCAWIEQILEFESVSEVESYKKKLVSGRPQEFEIVKESISGEKVLLHIKKQYNNNPMH